jgi:Phosphate-selective porin O and P
MHLPTSLRRAGQWLVIAALACPLAARADEAALERRLEKLSNELEAVKAELARLKKERQPAAGPAAAAPLPATPAATRPNETLYTNSEAPPSSEPDTVLSSYGEINYNRPRHATENAVADVRRLVLGLQHRFDAKTHLAFELESEHAVTSADDPGEVEVEQAFIEHRLFPQFAVRGGLFLIPAGLLNENHEPTAYYGVERNFVETAIIPTTWREGGVQFAGEVANGATLQAGLSTGFNINKWDAASTEGRESPLGAIHQELALASAHDLAVFAALNYRAIPGVLVGGSIFTGGAAQGAQGVPKVRVRLWDLHARWTPGAWDFSALYARGTMTNTAPFNTALVGNPTLVPALFDGAYVQGAYRLRIGGYGLAPFARLEFFNTGRRYDAIGAGLTPAPLPTERVITTGLNFDLDRNVVVKADMQWFRQVSANNRFNLGLGWSF